MKDCTEGPIEQPYMMDEEAAWMLFAFVVDYLAEPTTTRRENLSRVVTQIRTGAPQTYLRD